jgi:hypothetical protein
LRSQGFKGSSKDILNSEKFDIFPNYDILCATVKIHSLDFSCEDPSLLKMKVVVEASSSWEAKDIIRAAFRE